MPTGISWNGSAYSVPAAGEVGWAALSNFLIDLGGNAATTNVLKHSIRVATTSPVTVSDTSDCVVLSNLGVAGAVAVTLPAGTNGRWFIVGDQKGDAATNNITITPNGAETINGSATYVISENRGCVVLAYSTTNTRWNVVSKFSTLSPYVETTGTTALAFSGGNGTAALVGNNEHRVTRIGNRVFFTIQFAFTKGTASGDFAISGLPYASANISAQHQTIVQLGFQDGFTLPAGRNQIWGLIANNSSTITSQMQSSSGAGTAAIQASDLDAGTIVVHICGSYQA